MRIEVAVLPQLVQDLERKVCVVVDVLRATSSLVELIERGASAVWVAPSIAAAREQASAGLARLAGSGGAATAVAAQPMAGQSMLLCGEVGGLPPVGFDYGNSPSEFAGLDLREQEVVLCTSNGTKALRAVAAAPAVLAGSLLNARAVADAALALATAGGLDLAFVCSGKDLGTSYSLEDTYVAGYLVALLRSLAQHLATLPEPDFRPSEADLASLDDSAVAALRLAGAYRGDHRRVFAESMHGRHLEAIGLGYDLDYCAQTSIRQAVPRLVRGDGEALLVVGDGSGS